MINWTMIAALAAIAGVAAVVWQTRCTTNIQAILQLLAAWDGAPMFPRLRHTAALNGSVHVTRAMQHQGNMTAGIESGAPVLEATAHIDAILDFFETVASLTRRHWYEWSKPLSVKQAYDSFYWSMACYWVTAKDYIKETSATEGEDTWKGYCGLMAQFFKVADNEPTLKQVMDFFDDEMARTGINTAV